MAFTPALISPIEDARNFGPAMAKLSPKQRAWVVAFLETGHNENATGAARAAGYGDTSHSNEARDATCKTTGYRLRHDPKVLDAIQELSKDRFRIVAHRATEELVMLLSNEDPKVKLKAIDMILARTGLNTVQEVNVNHNHTSSDMDAKSMIRRIALLAESQGMDPVKLLGQRGVTIDAEFEVVETGSSTGLEDLL